jgi:hypothetical protein
MAYIEEGDGIPIVIAQDPLRHSRKHSALTNDGNYP